MESKAASAPWGRGFAGIRDAVGHILPTPGSASPLQDGALPSAPAHPSGNFPPLG